MGTGFGRWHPTAWSWFDTVVPAVLAIGGFELVRRAIDRPGWSARFHAAVGVLTTTVGVWWLFLAQPPHGP